MEHKFRIKSVRAREILDSRGNPTVEVEVGLCGGATGRGSVPSGASTGAFEAVELRDKDLPRYNGNGVKKAVEHVNNTISFLLDGRNALNQVEIDQLMLREDGTKNKGKFGANAILGVSIATARAAAKQVGLPLYQYLGGAGGRTLPVPMMNIINGGKHADSSLNIQEFMIMPVGANSFHGCLEWCCNVYRELKNILKSEGHITSVGDEGGFAPKLKSDEEALAYIVRAVEKAGYRPGEDFKIAIDGACTEMYDEAVKQGRTGEYLFWKNGQYKSAEEMVSFWEEICNKYPVYSIEDGLSEEDWEGWKLLTKRLGGQVQLVGDDLFVTNTERIRKGFDLDVANAVLIKPNQIGSVTETLEAIRMTKNNRWHAIVSHRSGETEDTTIADIAVGLNAGQIKTGAPNRTDRVCKYNQLLRIEEQLGESAVFEKL
ncbi:MAG: phosphopyruvate hydratase [Roseburia sp.]|nr:phosphopyruvate hydratase [Roseburia sp.]